MIMNAHAQLITKTFANLSAAYYHTACVCEV